MSDYLALAREAIEQLDGGNTMSNTKRKYNVLTRLQNHKLISWIEENIQTTRESTAAELADRLTEELGYKITKDNIQGCREELGIKVYQRKQAKDNQLEFGITEAEVYEDIAERIMELDKLVLLLRDRVDAIEASQDYNRNIIRKLLNSIASDSALRRYRKEQEELRKGLFGPGHGTTFSTGIPKFDGYSEDGEQ